MSSQKVPSGNGFGQAGGKLLDEEVKSHGEHRAKREVDKNQLAKVLLNDQAKESD